MTINILTHNDGIRHSGFEGQTVENARGLLILVAYALRYLQKTETTDPNSDLATIEDMANSFSFSDIHERTLQNKIMFCTLREHR